MAVVAIACACVFKSQKKLELIYSKKQKNKIKKKYKSNNQKISLFRIGLDSIRSHLFNGLNLFVR